MTTTYAPRLRLAPSGIDLRGAWIGESAWEAQNRQRLTPSAAAADSGQQTWFAGIGTMLSGAFQRLTPSADGARTGEVTQRIEQTLRDVEDLGVTLQDVTDLRAYLQDHPDMLEATRETATIAREGLSDGARMTLHLYRDPEIDDEYLTLFAKPPVLDLETLKATLSQTSWIPWGILEITPTMRTQSPISTFSSSTRSRKHATYLGV